MDFLYLALALGLWGLTVGLVAALARMAHTGGGRS